MLPAIRKYTSYPLLMSLALSCLLAVASAQGLTGQISGSLADSQGGASGARVEVTFPTQAERNGDS
jgi:hypothetical protein